MKRRQEAGIKEAASPSNSQQYNGRQKVGKESCFSRKNRKSKKSWWGVDWWRLVYRLCPGGAFPTSSLRPPTGEGSHDPNGQRGPHQENPIPLSQKHLPTKKGKGRTAEKMSPLIKGKKLSTALRGGIDLQSTLERDGTASKTANRKKKVAP